nr:NBS-LRR disease resistance protein [Dasypyrum villosum]
MAQAIIQRACSKLRSAMADEAVVRLNFTADLGDMLEALEHIQPMLDEAEMRRLGNRADEMAAYCHECACQAAYKTIYMVDELQDPRSRAAATMMTRMLPRLAITKNAMAIQVQETKKLVTLAHTKSREFSKNLVGSSIMLQKIIEKRKTGPVFEEAIVLGRGLDKERTIAALLSTEPNIMQVLPIFGFPGSGKTTLAQMVFNDTHSLQGYDFRVWVHVSPQFEFHTIGNSIIFHVSGRGQEEIDHSSSDMEMEGIMKRLHELLDGKKVLLVLDDLWEEDPIQLQLLKSMLTFLGDKMDVIVTTCNQAIARRICTVKPYRLNPLSDEACWEIIKKSICFEGRQEELEKIGREIASKCWGVPSIAREYACTIDSSRDAMTWKTTMQVNIWFINYSLDLSTFQLSYMRMPPDLRLCFAYYCEIFPSGHSIVKDDLVHHWIALHLIEPSEILSAAQIAENHITRLQDMSFLQTAEWDHAIGKEDKGAILFTMHNVVHDFAKVFLNTFTYCLATNYHGKPNERYGSNLRAIRCVGCRKVEFTGNLFSSNKWLRVLELTESSVLKLPDSIWQLKHLGYLKISEFSGLVTLPESLGDLINLIHIDLSGCSGLLNLPESFGKLIRLVHANLSGCSELLNLPESVGKLVNLVHINLSGCSRLATLPESFGDLINLSHVNLSRCHGLAELPEPLQKLRKLVHLDLSFWSCFEGIGKNLGGLTSLEHLNLSNPCCHLAAHRSHLRGLKDGLCKLTKLRHLNLSMCLNPIFYHHQSQEDSPQYIGECVSGLSSLEHLDLSHHTFLFGLPASLGELNKLKTLNLSGCIRLKMVGEMKSLKFINLRKCRGLESCQFMVRIVDDDDVYSSSNIVQLEEVNCQELQISCLEKVKSTEEARRIKLVEKQKIEKLKLSWTLGTVGRVEDSALLGELVTPPSLQCLEVNGYTGTSLPEYLGNLTSLQELKIVSCKQLNSLPDTMQKLTSLKDLCIFDCPELEKWCQVEENKKMLAHIPNKNYEEPASTSRQEIEEDDKSGNEVEAA